MSKMTVVCENLSAHNRHMATKEELSIQINASQMKHNSKKTTANWQFTTKDTRIKLHKLYPIP
ncbi:hypothetical protein QE390_002102 [Siphonobacter sp. SORGH_AS 1065]|nr:hypothetical protein [Siphonobacter sp. SORGH_AS_1065]